ncbi:Thrombopoietin receptor [Dirofilaria immitis]
MECTNQKKQTYEITNSMRSIAPQTMQQTSPTPIMPVYARDSPVIPYQGRQAPIGTIPVQISPPNIELKSNTKQSPSKDNVEPEALPEKEKDGAITNGKTRGGDGGVGIGSGSNGNRNSGGGGGGGCGGMSMEKKEKVMVDSMNVPTSLPTFSKISLMMAIKMGKSEKQFPLMREKCLANEIKIF